MTEWLGGDEAVPVLAGSLAAFALSFSSFLAFLIAPDNNVRVVVLLVLGGSVAAIAGGIGVTVGNVRRDRR